eukprot:CAMPEP_0179444182 /NCGR_PEP_ID=MMETSP0799-20121207/27656_1 /TAXON_ID=46947 /ORGANISM="Geminigera cryophila, Strain CCMP2564" /LENGTH=147 /DNA_ID=CAMNT_0021231025 /DNA_START=138 /DNA_END=580 /DNA_ORIENTATION=-
MKISCFVPLPVYDHSQGVYVPPNTGGEDGFSGVVPTNKQTNKQTNKYDPETEGEVTDMPDLNCIPPDQHDQDWALLRCMVITVIDEIKNSDASTDVNDSIKDVNDFLVTVSTTAVVNSLDLSSADIADREIKIKKDMEDSHRSLSQG